MSWDTWDKTSCWNWGTWWKQNSVCSQWHSHWGGKGGRVPPLTAKNLSKIGKKRKKSGKLGKKIRKNRGKKEEKSGRNGKNREISCPLPLLTDRAGYATVCSYGCNGTCVRSEFGWISQRLLWYCLDWKVETRDTTNWMRMGKSLRVIINICIEY